MSQIVKVLVCMALVVALDARDGFPGRRVGGGTRIQEQICLLFSPDCPI